MANSNWTENELFMQHAVGLDCCEAALWHKSAPRGVRRAFRRGEFSPRWDAWKKHLAKRSKPADPLRLLPGGRGAMCWGLPEGTSAGRLSTFLRQIEGWLATSRSGNPSPQSQLLCWLDQWAGSPPQLDYALQAVAWGRTLPRLAAAVSPRAWWALLRHLLSAVNDAAAITLDDQPLVHQLLAGELPLTLAYLFPEITPCRRLGRSGRQALSLGLMDLLDGKGLPHANHLALLRPLLACWTRCRALRGGLNGGCWAAAAEAQYRWLVGHALRLCRHDGTQVFAHDGAAAFHPKLFAAALRLGGSAADRGIAARMLPPQPPWSAWKRTRKAAWPKPALHSPWAAAAVLSPKWSRSGERLTVVYPRQSVQLEMACGDDVLWSGLWEFEVRFDGQPAAPNSEWDEICWVSDEDVDYLELEIGLSGGLRVQRHLLLARQDRFLLLADSILGDRPGVINYRGILPLCRGIAFRGMAATREGVLVGRKRRALVLPLALPEWRSDVRSGELVQTAAGLELFQAAEGCRLFAPLFFDLDRRRMTRRLTWRQLTVAQSLTVQPHDVAVGYRVAIGKRQWLIYRSLAQRGNRTLLGHNVAHEMLIARFDRSGEVETLLEVE